MDSLNAREKKESDCGSYPLLLGRGALAVSAKAESREGVETERFCFAAEMSDCCLVISSG